MFKRSGAPTILAAVIPLILSCSAKDPIVGPTGGGGGGSAKGWNWVAPLPQGNRLNAVYSVSSNVAVAVGDNGTIVRTTNGGASWSVVASPTTLRLNDVSFGSDSNGLAVGDDGIALRTTNGGASWTQIVSTTTEDLQAVYCVDASVATVVGFGETVLRTTDLGNSWTSQSSNGISFLYDVSFFDANTGAIATDGNVLWTTDGGTNWTTRAVSGSPSLRGISVVSGTVAIAIGEDFFPNTRFYKTTNSGVNWVASAESFSFAVALDIHFIDLLTGYGVYSSGIARTTDGGASWSALAGPRSPRAVSASGNAVTAVGNSGLLFRSDDGGDNWNEQSNSITTFLGKVEFFDGQTGVAVGSGIYRTTNGGQSWTKVDDNSFVEVSFGSATGGVAVGSSGIYRSADAGVNWVQSISNYTTQVHMGTATAGLSTSCTNGRFARRTTDGGVTWVEVTEPEQICYNGPFVLNANTIIVVGQLGRIYRTTNGGGTWTQLASGSSNTLVSINFNASRSIGLAVGSNGTIVRTTDQGLTWGVEASGTTASLRDVTFSDETTAYAVGSGGTVLKSVDAGLTWQSQTVPTAASLQGIAFATPDVGVIVGIGGIILRTTNGGEQ